MLYNETFKKVYTAIYMLHKWLGKHTLQTTVYE